jgi:hypothetical protein
MNFLSIMLLQGKQLGELLLLSARLSSVVLHGAMLWQNAVVL